MAAEAYTVYYSCGPERRLYLGLGKGRRRRVETAHCRCEKLLAAVGGVSGGRK